MPTMGYRRCAMMGGGAVAAVAALLAMGVPVVVLLVLAPVIVCLALHVLIGQGDPDGRHLLETAQRAVRPFDK